MIASLLKAKRVLERVWWGYTQLRERTKVFLSMRFNLRHPAFLKYFSHLIPSSLFLPLL